MVKKHCLAIPRLHKGSLNPKVLEYRKLLSHYTCNSMPDVYPMSPLQLIPKNKDRGTVSLVNEAFTIARTNRRPWNNGIDVPAPRKHMELIRAHSDNNNCNSSVPARKSITSVKYITRAHSLYSMIS